MFRLTRTVLSATALLAAVSAAQANDASSVASKTIYNMVGAMLVEGATKSDDFTLNSNGPAIPPEAYSASDALNNETYTPDDGVTCYPKQQLCFKASGKIDTKWTSRIYAN